MIKGKAYGDFFDDPIAAEWSSTISVWNVTDG